MKSDQQKVDEVIYALEGSVLYSYVGHRYAWGSAFVASVYYTQARDLNDVVRVPFTDDAVLYQDWQDIPKFEYVDVYPNGVVVGKIK